MYRKRFAPGIIITTMLLSFISVCSVAQDFKLKLPDLLPPSPEVASMVNAGYGSLNRNSGAVSASLPLYQLTVNGFTWPIGLSYSSQGLKIDETSSRVGYGWNLNANGVISRSVKGVPDDVATRRPIPSTLGAVDTATLNFAYNIGQESSAFDSEYDVYHFSFNGYAGKMVFNDSNQAIVTSHNNLKIQRTGWHQFTITATDGVKYYFGSDAYERTITHNLNVAAPFKNNTRTAYFLYRIELPAGGWINFTYSSMNIASRSGISQTLQRTGTTVEDPCTVCPAPGAETFSENISSIEYQTQYLSSITTSTGQTVSFSYQAKPDLSGDKRVTSIVVSTAGGNLKHYNLSYIDPAGFSGPTTHVSRFFLNKVSEVPVSAIGVSDSYAKQTEFTYHDLVNMGGQPYSKQQDYFGFYNGNTGNLLTPEGVFGTSVIVNGNRTPNPQLAQQGMLTSIKYATGGSENFHYEPNTLPKSEEHSYPQANVYMYGFFQGGQTHYTYSSPVFNMPITQTVPVNLTSYYSNGTPGYLPSERIVQFYIKRGNDTIIHEFMNGNDNRQVNVQFQSGYNYQILMRIRQDAYNGGSVDLSYDTTTAKYYTYSNEITGGLRLRKISYSDRPGNIVKNKFFFYAPVSKIAASQGGALITEGIGHRRGFFSAQGLNSIWCDGSWGSYAICRMNVLSTNSAYNTFEFEGSNIYYNTVVESDDSLFANGASEYKYFDYDQATNNEVLRGSEETATMMGNYGTMNGMLEWVKQFNSNFQLVAEQRDIYEGVSVPGKSLYSYYVQKKYEPILNSAYLQREVDAFDIVRYRHWDRWIRKIGSVSRKYEAAGQVITDSSLYQYSTAANILPQQTLTFDSKGQQIKVTQSYPTDFASQGIFPAMIAANLVAAPYETALYIDNVLQQQKRIKYKTPQTGLFVPDTIQLKSTPTASLTDEQFFRIYDQSGNPVQFNKVNDVSMVYLWDHSRSFVVAQVVNAQLSQVAYSSFEGDGWGNWKPVSGSSTINLDGGYTGSRSFTGTLRDTISITGSYVLTAWSNSGSPTVNGSTGTSVKTKKGWTLYKWSLTNPTNISVVGTRMDEVRLHPLTAQMVTYTHLPYIGISSQCDLNHRVMRYEYDGFQRLMRVRDEDDNILKQICYNFSGEEQRCGVTVYYSVVKSGNFTRNNCGTNGTGTTVTYTVAAGTYTSLVDQATADAAAQQDVNTNGQAYANTNGSCSWTNNQQSGSFTRNNCGAGGTGGTVTYTVAAGTHSSTVSLAAANQLAVNAVNANGQAYANANASCTWLNQTQSNTFTRNNCGVGATAGSVTYTIAAGTYSSNISQADANQQATNAVNAGGQAYANSNATCTWYNTAQSGSLPETIVEQVVQEVQLPILLQRTYTAQRSARLMQIRKPSMQ